LEESGEQARTLHRL